MRCNHARLFPLELEVLEVFKPQTVSTKLNEFPKIPHIIHNIAGLFQP